MHNKKPLSLQDRLTKLIKNFSEDPSEKNTEDFKKQLEIILKDTEHLQNDEQMKALAKKHMVNYVFDTVSKLGNIPLLEYIVRNDEIYQYCNPEYSISEAFVRKHNKFVEFLCYDNYIRTKMQDKISDIYLIELSFTHNYPQILTFLFDNKNLYASPKFLSSYHKYLSYATFNNSFDVLDTFLKNKNYTEHCDKNTIVQSVVPRLLLQNRTQHIIEILNLPHIGYDVDLHQNHDSLFIQAYNLDMKELVHYLIFEKNISMNENIYQTIKEDFDTLHLFNKRNLKETLEEDLKEDLSRKVANNPNKPKI